jgi:hypothetical protein
VVCGIRYTCMKSIHPLHHGVIYLFILSNYSYKFIYFGLGVEKVSILIPSTFSKVIM